MSISEQYLLRALRNTMKKNGLKFTQLSELSGVPISSLKRQFHNPNLGIDKIIMYASYMNTDILRLAKEAKNIQHGEVNDISEKNSEIFSEHPYLFDFAYQILSLKMSINDIKKEHALSDKSISFYLRALEIMGYLKIIGDQRVKLSSHSHFYIKEGTKLDEMFVERFKKIQYEECKRPNMYFTNFNLSNQQIEQLERNIFDQINTLHLQNNNNTDSTSRNIMFSIIPGATVKLADTIPEVSGDLLKIISKNA